MSAAIGVIIQGVLAAVSAAPQVAEVIASAKGLISSLFTAKVITVEVQNALHAYVDAHVALVNAGLTPPAWTVEADPKA